MNLFNISFLAPVALLGLLALAIPIYLHMRHKPRAEIFKFPAIDFLLKAQKKRKRRFRVEQWLLMAFRIIIIALLAMLFAKPFIDNNINEKGFRDNQPLVFILDDSASMLAGGANNRFFERAIDQIRDLIANRDAESPVFLMPASRPTAHLETGSADGVNALLGELKATSYALVLDGAYHEAIDLIQRQNWSQATIHILTDGSRSAWRELPAQKPEKVEVVYTSLLDENPDFQNVSITNVAQSPGDTNSVEITLLNSGGQSRDTALRIEGSGFSPLQHRMRIDASASASHRFGLGDPLPPTLTVRIPDDSFELDNQVIFAPKPNKTIRILIVDGDTHPDSVRNESFFFRNALGGEESEGYGYQIETVTPVGFERSHVAQNDVLCFLNVDAPPTDLMKEALKQGKGVFISMGDRMDFERWNLFFPTIDLELWEAQRLPEGMGAEIKLPNHPFLTPIGELAWNGYLQNMSVEALRLMSVGRSQFEIPIALNNGSPLLLAKDLAPGRVLIWTSTLDLDWNNFPIEFGFVPFSRHVIAYLAGQESATSYLSYTVNEIRDQDLIDTLNLKYMAKTF